MAIGAWFLYDIYNDFESKTIDNSNLQLKIQVDQAANGIENLFNSYENSLKFLSSHPSIQNLDENGKDLMRKIFASNSDIVTTCTRIDENARIIYTVPENPGVIGADLTSQAHNRYVIREQKPIISDVFVAVQGYRSMAFVYPVFNDDSVYTGCITFLISFDYIEEKFLTPVENLSLGKMWIVNKEGTEIFCYNDSHIDKPIKENVKGFSELLSFVDTIYNKDQGIGTYNYKPEYSDENVLMTAYFKRAQLSNTYWVLTSSAPIKSILLNSQHFKNDFFLTLLIFSTGVLLLGLLYLRSLKRASGLLIENEKQFRVELENTVEERTRELLIAKEKAETSEKLKMEFLAQMSHEIRTPINTILNFSSLIQMEFEDQLEGEMIGVFTSIGNASDRLLRTVDLILNMSEVEAGALDTDFEDVDIPNGIIGPLFSQFIEKANKKKLEFRIENSSKSPIVYADSYTSTQIFANLIDNAIKYTNEGFVKVLIEDDDKFVTIKVIDSGIGISKEFLPNLFQVFTQEEQGYTRRFEGNGLGLALVKKYIAINEASIDVDSIKGKGTTFIVKFKK